ncbi:CDP-glycerol glycerophosphotransferase family protein [Streptomyces sp. VRA16 Mangrove soil]|uniref:CDP-glycerol glycerophosphotransferase family protein n=1 Tax=Streptomyces sp. VRA16 Mangrove soil TaxID=2817434 RepID=UPI001A9CC881|nr:CDP-glycerol glycerophosphotransferase family protein [Streptomyces sp. VRA16 Mangrove soil]MBO1337570.1 CDP-glycerol glycerophosphotransferase family protein [Streptomyces sp. VRA16 Mangrove soil]
MSAFLPAASTAAQDAELFDVSVVVDCPAGTDPARLRETVRSVLDQTLAGTEAALVGDGVGDAGAALAADHPHRVRTGAPRGTFVLPLAPGERLERNACRNLFAAARRTDADLVAGRWTRPTGPGAKERAPEWQADLYGRSRVVTGVAEAPELVTRDALDAGCAVRRTRWNPGAAGVDLALAARRIALVPNLITRRPAAPDPREGLRAAAVAQRHALAVLPDAELRGARARAFLADHVLPCARAFLGLDRTRRTELAVEYAGLLDGLISESALRELPALERVAVALLADGDAEGVLAAAYALERPGTVVVPPVGRDGRVYWSAAHTTATYDITELGCQHRPLSGLKPLAKVTRCLREGGRLVIKGRVVAPLGLFDGERATTLTADLALKPRGAGGDGVRVPVDDVRLKGEHIVWRASVPLTRILRPRGIGDRNWDPRLLLTVDGEHLPPLDLFAEKDAVDTRATALPARPRLSRLTADTWQPYVTAGHHLAVCLLPKRRLARKANALARYATTFRPARVLKRSWKKAAKKYAALHSRRTKTSVYRHVLRRLPVSRGTVVFESHMGKCYGDSPRAVHEELTARRRGARVVWSYATSRDGFPQDATLVRRWSWRYLWALARAEWWVDNQGFPHALDKPEHTTYLQTWHGSAYKRMGYDEIRHKTQNAPQREQLMRAVGRFDKFLVRSEHDVDTLARAYRIPEDRLMRIGYPRNDRLVAARERDEREGRFPRPALAAELGIPDHKTVVLYAPTFRGTPKTNKKAQLLLDVGRFAERFGDTHVLLVRAHYMEAASLPVTPYGTVHDVSAHHDVSELLCLADVLITDYSSIMFDYALLDRPIVHFAPDLDRYTAERGSYFDLRARAGGPVVETQDALHRTLGRVKESDAEWQEARRAFAAEFGTYDDGGAARAVVDALFTRKAGK